ncbi:Histidinol-phosphatase [Roseovarius albus]|uniref:Histidinol-phosphatase n=1 Tax=Roseovarius albus TaxID=1247867 RepID=A0A1X6YMG1_9RHOB|nr:inositol monophosphatase family protein [Roseovarius albus]SLN23922.1 Histidinol-phosphatase [Roseovarius albus]
MNSDKIIESAHAMADAARVAVLPYFRSANLNAEDKGVGGYDPVTEGDRAAERAMRDVLAQLRPQDGILGEEFANKPTESGLTWVLDPIDGTRSFIAGAPTWGVLIAVSDESGPIYGIIDQPYIGERFEGGLARAKMTGPHGTGALRVRGSRPLSQSMLFSTYPNLADDTDTEAFNEVSAQVQLTRFGIDCYAYALVASGQIDLVIESGLQAYDIQAPIAVIEAAGGVVTDWQGGKAHNGGRVVAAAGPEQHAAALEILSKY